MASVPLGVVVVLIAVALGYAARDASGAILAGLVALVLVWAIGRREPQRPPTRDAAPAAPPAPRARPAPKQSAVQPRSPDGATIDGAARRSPAEAAGRAQRASALSQEQRAVLQRILASPRAAHFVTGPAGTGKSTLLGALAEATKGRAAVVAPTGIAAIHVGGQTIHALFKFPPRCLRYRHPEDIRRFNVHSSRRKLLQGLELLIIDEVSMVRADVLDAIDWSLRVNRDAYSKPFGGVGVVMFGDPLQLEPVVRDDERPYLQQLWGGAFFFHAQVWREVAFHIHYLTELHRQHADPAFAHTLRCLHEGKREALAALDVCVAEGRPAADDAVVLAPRRQEVESINLQRLQELPPPDVQYDAQITGEFPERDMPTEKTLHLRRNAQVMLLRNTPAYVNGDLATVLELEREAITVRLHNGGVVSVQPHTWERIEYDYDEQAREIRPKVVGSFRQLPVRLAWALTIHKAQGLTLDAAHVAFGDGMFAHGQLYVAVTRCKTRRGLTISRPIRERDLIWHESVVAFVAQCRRQPVWGGRA